MSIVYLPPHRTGDLHYLKRLNRSAILEMIRQTPGLTRADIATQAQLTKATVGNSVQTLLGQGWLSEGELHKSSGGRPGRALHLNDEHFALLGAEVGVHGLRLVACTLSGNIIESHHEQVLPASPEATAHTLAQLLKELKARPSMADRHCLGIGIALPGPVDPAAPVLRLAPNLNWQDVRFLDLIRPLVPEATSIWLMDNEAKSAAFGELYFRTGNIPHSLAYVSLGTGIGGGMVTDQSPPQLSRGAQGLAGEIGHTVLQPNGQYCHCGNRGCAETLASGWAIRAALGIAEDINLVDAISARQHDEDVQYVLRRAGETLGILLLNLHHTQNAAEIVLGGSLVQLGPAFLAPAQRYFATNQNRLLGNGQKVRLRILDDATFVAARGAAAQVLATVIHGSNDLV